MDTNRFRLMAAALAVVALGLTAACSDGDSVTSAGKGRLNVALSASSGTQTAAAIETGLRTALASSPAATIGTTHDDDDGPELAAVNVTFSAILARNLSGELVPVEMALPVVVDVLALLEGPTVTLPVGLLPPGDYDQIVVNMTAVELVTTDDFHITIEPPGGGWTAIVPADPFTVLEGETTAITLRLRMDRAFRFLEGKIEFHPEFECENDD